MPLRKRLAPPASILFAALLAAALLPAPPAAGQAGNADLFVTKTGSQTPVNVGSNLTYTITVGNGALNAALAASLSDPLPAGTSFVSLASPADWSCTTPAVGSGGTVSCTNPSFGHTSEVFTLVVQITPSAPAGGPVSNTAIVSATNILPDPSKQHATTTAAVLSPAHVTATKSVFGQLRPGGAVTYTVVLSNSGPSPQADNPGPELTDVLPPSLTLVSATATSGMAVPNVGTNTVTWDGSIPAGGTVTITIQATIDPNVGFATVISNQATGAFDADGDGTNERLFQSDDPSTTVGGDATSFTVGAQPVTEVPTLDGLGLFALTLLLAGLGAWRLRKKTAQVG